MHVHSQQLCSKSLLLLDGANNKTLYVILKQAMPRAAAASEAVADIVAAVNRVIRVTLTESKGDCGGSLVDSAPFVRRVAGSNPVVYPPRRDLDFTRNYLWRFGVKLQHSIRAVCRECL